MKSIKTLSRTTLFKATTLNSVSVLLKIGSGLVTSKLLALFVGPAGMALTGNFRNFMTSIETIATLGFQNGIVKYIVAHKNDEKELRTIMATVFFSLLCVVVFLSSLLFGFSEFLNSAVFGAQYQYASVFKVLAFALPWYAMTIFLVAAINGLGKFRKVIRINIFGNIIGVLISAFLIWKLHTFGALLSLVIPPALLFFVTFYYINKEIRFLGMLSLRSFDWQVIRNLSAYSLMTLVASLFGPLVFLAIRNNIIVTLGIEQAGFWEAINRLSTYYLMFISTILSVYFFPKLAFSTTDKATRNVFRSYYSGILPFFIVGLILLYLLRFFVVKSLFTQAFLPMTGLFFWQLIGDILKAASMILGYQFFAKKMTFAFIATELLSLSLMYGLSYFFLSVYGIEGIVMAHALTYFIYFCILAFYFRKRIF